jgi:lysylphosphatidylglycerol synthetase-like protein (DUF2156 family)
MWLAFSVCMPIAVILARVKSSHWFNIHRGLLSLSTTLVLVSAGLMVLGADGGSQYGLHGVLGLVVVGLVLVQALSGMFRVGKESGWRAMWFLQHAWLGRIILLLGTLNIIVGVFYYESRTVDNSFAPFLAAPLLCICIFFITLLYFYYRGRDERRKRGVEIESLQL